MKKYFLPFLIAAPILGGATEYHPWYNQTMVGEIRNTHRIYTYDRVESPTGDLPDSDTAYTMTLAFGINPIDVFTGSYSDDWYGEAELNLMSSHQHSFGFDDVRLTVRKRFLEDIVGDPVTLTAGATLIAAWRQALYDLSSFHHGLYEAEFHLAAGKEWSCGARWVHRIWGLALVGVAEQGSPWLKGRLVYDFNQNDRWFYQFFCEALWGLGKDDLDLGVPFRGYGPIRHQSIDLGTEIRYQTESGNSIAFKAARRVHEKDFPENARMFYLEIFIPFSF